MSNKTPVEGVDAEKKIENVMIRLITGFPFFSVLMLQLGFYEQTDEMNPTMCTDGTHIYYNRKFTDSLSYEECAFVIVHEVMHCALGHLWRRGKREHKLWNIATDFAINGIIYEVDKAISQKDHHFRLKMHKGMLFEKDFLGKPAEEIYNILLKQNPNQQQTISNGGGQQGKCTQQQNGSGGNNSMPNKRKQQGGGGGGSQKKQGGQVTYNGNGYNAPTNHESWKKEDESSEEHKRKQQTKWDGNLMSAAEQIDKSCGSGSLGLERALESIRNPQKDWRILLHEFIQEDVNDYSLMPPDHRYEGEFFLFDFNDTIEVVNDILFFVDTSGSMGEKEIQMCYSEIQGAINQFSKHLHGTLLFFDHDVSSKYYNFDDHDGDISKLIPYGGGGTSYECIFKFIRKNREKFDNINGVIILTDGYCEYPQEEITDGVPILWVYTTPNNEPPFGRKTTLDVNED